VFLTRHLLRRWKRIKLRQTEGKKTTNEWKLGAKKNRSPSEWKPPSPRVTFRSICIKTDKKTTDRHIGGAWQSSAIEKESSPPPMNLISFEIIVQF